MGKNYNDLNYKTGEAKDDDLKDIPNKPKQPP